MSTNVEIEFYCTKSVGIQEAIQRASDAELGVPPLLPYSKEKEMMIESAIARLQEIGPEFAVGLPDINALSATYKLTKEDAESRYREVELINSKAEIILSYNSAIISAREETDPERATAVCACLRRYSEAILEATGFVCYLPEANSVIDVRTQWHLVEDRFVPKPKTRRRFLWW